MVKEAADLREKTTGELGEELLKAKQKALDIRMKAPTNEGENPYMLRNLGKRIARIMTILNERQRQESAAPKT